MSNSYIGGQTRDVDAGCDECAWGGGSSAAARAHHVETGHVTWVKTITLTFYGDPLTTWMARQGMTRTNTSEADS